MKPLLTALFFALSAAPAYAVMKPEPPAEKPETKPEPPSKPEPKSRERSTSRSEAREDNCPYRITAANGWRCVATVRPKKRPRREVTDQKYEAKGNSK